VGLIYLDACLLIYLVERHPRWHQPTVDAIRSAPDALFGISPLVKLECLAGAMARRDGRLERAYLSAFEQLVVLDMPEDVYIDAAELRGRRSLRTPDALHLACARHHDCSALWTNDDRLHGAGGKLARNVLRR
jgi:uncharacterized protein